MQAHMKKNLFFCKGKGIFLQVEIYFSARGKAFFCNGEGIFLRTIVSLL